MRKCTHCIQPLVDPKTGEPRYDAHTCGDDCAKLDRKEKLAAKRARERAKIERRVQAELRRCCKKCPANRDLTLTQPER